MNDTQIPAFAKISKAHEITGVSKWYIRKGCLDGSIPCFRSGNTIYVNMRELLEQLDRLSKSGRVVARTGEGEKDGQEEQD